VTSNPTSEPLDYADRWLRDGLRVLRCDLAVMQVTVDMTNALRALNALRRTGVLASPAHVLVHAAARALGDNPSLHQVVVGNRRYHRPHVDIGLSITGDAIVVPVMVIEEADRKSIADIATEVAARAAQVQEADQKMLKALRTWGRLVPFGFARRAILRLLFSNATFRRKGAGTFQVSVIPAESGFTSSFSTAGVLFGGQVTSRVVVVDGAPAVRPMMTLTLSGDHGVWNGRAATSFMAAVKTIMESST
jgi:pyruvate/2-oxoglutarate dehydrogenase complex dihydrolipoamide acyltransferase (E2) component